MVSPSVVPAGEYVATADQRLVMYNVPWAHYEVQLALRGEASVPRMAYLAGALELMTPSKGHERTATYIGRLVDIYALERDIELSAYRSWTLKASLEEAGAEPDECYIFGADQSGERPDLVIEVIWTSGSIDKLAIYRRLRIPEVWFWRDGRVTVHVLDGLSYRESRRSTFLPDLDLELLCSFLDRPTQTQAMRDFRDHLRRTATSP
ncbi:MAG TPA: Uma2 family endonuclease [Kofleriaceae bacterium]|nr:Uma2 family endonuclease [Kofleriaceae bacterium]